jgi:hypothetical protein
MAAFHVQSKHFIRYRTKSFFGRRTTIGIFFPLRPCGASTVERVAPTRMSLSRSTAADAFIVVLL